MIKHVPALLAAGLLSACSLAPTYERPAAPVAAQYPAASSPESPKTTATATISPADTAWRDYFRDPQLQQLIAAALDHNRDLRSAALRIEEARALYSIQLAERLPALNGNAAASRAQTPATLAPGGASVIGERYDVGVAMPAFELDFFGRVKSLSDAARATYLATDEARRAAQISLVAQVAQAYYAERAFAQQAAQAQQTFEARARTYELTQQRAQVGASSLLDLRLNETLMHSARAAALALARQRAQAANALTMLVGQPPATPPAGAMPDDAQLDALSALPAGLPSELIARRPDILAAELRLKAANANIGAARAAFFPRVSLSAAVGSSSPTVGGLFGSGSWSFNPQLVLPIFDSGRNRANLDLSEVRKNLAVADYEKTIQVAFREVADALAARDYLGAQVEAQRAVQVAQADRLRLLQLRFDNGVANTLDVLDAQRELFAAEQALVQARLLRTTSAIGLYRALGGGLK